MKNSIFILLLTLAPAASHAVYMTPAELERAPKCTKQKCFGQNGGKSFLFYCESAWPSVIPGTIAVYGPLADSTGTCFCPCTLEYLAGARR